MNLVWTFAILILAFVTTLLSMYGLIPSISAENRTCINSNITKLGNQTINLGLLNEDYFKNLTSDNPELAQLICQDILNHTPK